MKTLKTFIALMLLLDCSMHSFAQVSLDHTFTPTSSYYLIGFENIAEPIDYYCFISSDHQISLYNPNYTLYKTINVNLPQGYSLSSVASAGKHIINTDDKVELFVSAGGSTTDNNNSTALIINEDGQIIHSFGYNYFIYCYGFHAANEQIKMLVTEYHITNQQTYELSYLYSIYSCFGNFTPTRTTSFSTNTNLLSPYPNPAVNFINLPYKLMQGKTSVIRIYNMNGQLMDSYNIGSDFEAISIDVSRYIKGVYTYEYDGISNKFIVQ